MGETLIVSSRGQLTLPANLRKRFGVKDGGAVILEDRDNEVVIKPARVLEVEMYSAAQIAEWDKDDQLDASGRDDVLKRLAARK